MKVINYKNMKLYRKGIIKRAVEKIEIIKIKKTIEILKLSKEIHKTSIDEMTHQSNPDTHKKDYNQGYMDAIDMATKMIDEIINE